MEELEFGDSEDVKDSLTYFDPVNMTEMKTEVENTASNEDKEFFINNVKEEVENDCK